MRAEAFVHRDGTGMFTLDDGTVELVRAATPADARLEVVRLATKAAVAAGEVVEVEALVAGEPSLITVGPTGEIGGTTPGTEPTASPVSETVARNDAEGLVAAGVRPADLLDAATLASARLRLVEQAGFGTDAVPPTAAAQSSEHLASAPTTSAIAEAHHDHRRRRAVVPVAAAGLLLLVGSGVALAATGHHRAPVSPSTRPTVASSTTLTAASASTASTVVPRLGVTVAGRVGRVVVRLSASPSVSLTLRLTAPGASPIQQQVDLAPEGRATVRLTVPAASYDWTVTTSDGRRRQGQVVVAAPSPSATPTSAAPPPHLATPHRPTASARPSSRPSSRPTAKSRPKPKVHASVPDSPIGREVA